MGESDLGQRARRYFDFPIEVTTAGGMLATIEAIAPDDEDRFFIGRLWPLGARKIPTTWRRSGQPTDGSPGLDFDPTKSEMGPLIAAPRD